MTVEKHFNTTHLPRYHKQQSRMGQAGYRLYLAVDKILIKDMPSRRNPADADMNVTPSANRFFDPLKDKKLPSGPVEIKAGTSEYFDL
jgi:hypothetical protein